MYIDEDVYVAHFGIKGMQWGVRKDQKAAVANFTKATSEVARRQQSKRYANTIQPKDFDQLDTHDVRIPVGSVVKRTSDTPNEIHDNLYISIHDSDSTWYKGLIPTQSTGGVPTKTYSDYYETTYRTLKELKSPSEKTRVLAYAKIMDTPVVITNSGAMTGRDYLRERGLGRTVDAYTSKELALTYYGQLVATQGIRNDPLNTAYFKGLRDAGYNAVIDDNDKGIMAKTPMLLLSSSKTVIAESTIKLSDADIRNAQKAMVPPN